MSRNRIISLVSVPACPAAAIAFYDRYRGKIAMIDTIEQRNNILADMQEDFEKMVRHEPQNRNKLSKAYQLLKQKCQEI